MQLRPLNIKHLILLLILFLIVTLRVLLLVIILVLLIAPLLVLLCSYLISYLWSNVCSYSCPYSCPYSCSYSCSCSCSCWPGPSCWASWSRHCDTCCQPVNCQSYPSGSLGHIWGKCYSRRRGRSRRSSRSRGRGRSRSRSRSLAFSPHVICIVYVALYQLYGYEVVVLATVVHYQPIGLQRKFSQVLLLYLEELQKELDTNKNKWQAIRRGMKIPRRFWIGNICRWRCKPSAGASQGMCGGMRRRSGRRSVTSRRIGVKVLRAGFVLTYRLIHRVLHVLKLYTACNINIVWLRSVGETFLCSISSSWQDRIKLWGIRRIRGEN